MRWADGTSTTAGRCKPCRLVFTWETGAKRRLYMARCPRCGERLSQTVVSLLKRPRFSKVPPVFEPVKP